MCPPFPAPLPYPLCGAFPTWGTIAGQPKTLLGRCFAHPWLYCWEVKRCRIYIIKKKQGWGQLISSRSAEDLHKLLCRKKFAGKAVPEQETGILEDPGNRSSDVWHFQSSRLPTHIVMDLLWFVELLIFSRITNATSHMGAPLQTAFAGSYRSSHSHEFFIDHGETWVCETFPLVLNDPSSGTANCQFHLKSAPLKFRT